MISRRKAVFTTPEDQQIDLNADGDRDDLVVEVHDLDTGITSNLARATVGIAGIDDALVAFVVFESMQGQDLNGDLDADDVLLQIHDLATGADHVTSEDMLGAAVGG